MKGAALNAWVEFRKEHRTDIYDSAIDITGFTEGKKGRIVFRVPTFALRDVSAETNERAMELDKQFQAWLKGYFGRRTADQTEAPADSGDRFPDGTQGEPDNAPLTDDDIPF